MIYSKKSGGNVAPSRFVTLSTTADNTVTQCGTDGHVYGISQAGVRRTPYSSLDDGYAAISGEDLEVFGVGEVCLLEVSATVAAGDRLKSDTNGKGTPVTTTLDNYGAIATVSAVSGQVIMVEVHPHHQYVV